MNGTKMRTYKVAVAVGFGLIGFLVNFLDIEFIEGVNFKISILAGLFFPLVIALAWGWRYGLLSALAGGCQTMWWLWQGDGWGILYSVPVFTLWVVWHGWWAEHRVKGHPWSVSSFAVEVPFRIVIELGFLVVFRWLVSLNPPPWNPGISWDHVSSAWLQTVAIKHVVTAYTLLLAAYVALSLGAVRRFFGLPRRPAQRDTTAIYTGTALFGLLLWTLSALVHYFLFPRDGQTFWGVAVHGASAHEVFMRSVYIAVTMLGGIILARLNRHRVELKDLLDHRNRVLRGIRNVNQLIVSEDDPRRLIEQACINLTEAMGYHNAWIALLGGETARNLGLPDSGPLGAAAVAGFDDGFSVLRNRLERGAFPDCMNRAIENGDVVVVDDPVTHCPDCPLHGEYGGYAGLARHLDFDGVTYGILTVSAPAAYARDTEEQALFDEVAGDLAFALHKIASARRHEQSQQRMSLVVDGSGTGTWEWNIQTNETVFNEHWVAMLGYTIEELTPCDYTTWERLLHPDDLDRARRALTDCVEGRIPAYNCEFRMQHKDGRWIWILDRGRVMTRDAEGNAISMFGTHTNITEIKQAEEALRQAKELTERIIHDGPVAITRLDCNGKIVFANRHAEDLLGVDASRLEDLTYNAPDWQITDVDGSPLPDERLPFSQVMATDQAVYDICHAITAPDGKRKILSINGAPLHDEAGRIDGVVFAVQDITERKQAERQLHAEKEWSEKLVKYAPNIVIGLREKSEIVTFNRFAEKMTGWTAEEVCGKEWIATFIPEEQREELYRVWDEIVDNQLIDHCFENEIITRSGERRLIEWHNTVIKENGHFKMILSLGVDITERKQAEQALEASEEMMRTSQAVAHICAYSTDLNVHEIEQSAWVCSPEFYNIFGIDESYPHTIAGWAGLLHPDHRDEVVAYHESVIKQKTSFDKEYKIIRINDGAERWVQGTGELELDENGTPVRMYGAIQDITERKQAEETLSKSEAFMSKMVANIADVIVIIDPDEVNRFKSPNIEKFFGWKPEEVVGKSTLELVHPEDMEKAGKVINRLLEQPDAVESTEVRYRCKDGSYKWIEFTGINLIHDPYIQGILGNYHDISERKQAEQALQASESRVRTKLNALLDPEGDLKELKLADVVDCEQIQSLMNDFYALTNISLGIVDLEGNILVAVGYQDICTKFHRVHPDTLKNCLESDTQLSSGVEPGTFKVYKCKNNMWDMVTPILIGENHVGNLFLGQFLFDDEEPDLDLFREQARRYGFDEEAYLQAYCAVPRWSREKADQVMTFYSSLIDLISHLSYAQIKLARTSESLRQSEEKFRSLADMAKVMIFIVANADGAEYLYVNKEWERLHGYTKEEAQNIKPIDTIAPEYRQQVLDNASKRFEGKPSPSSYELQIVTKSGERKHLDFSSTIINFGDQKAFLTTAVDITERKQAEAELLRLSTAIEQSPEVVLITDAEGTIQYVNPAFTAITGYSREEAIGQNPRILKSGKQDASFYSDMWSTLLAGEVWSGETINKRKDGTLYTDDALIAPVKDASGTITNFVGIKRDITEELEREQMFRQSQKMDSVGQLAGGIAHDFNNMLQVILGFAELLLNDIPSTSGNYRCANEIKKAAQRAADLTRQLLTFSRKLPAVKKEINLNETIQENKVLLDTLLGESIRIDLQLADDLRPAYADPGQLSQVIMNLAVNARDAMPDGGRLSITTDNVMLSKEDVEALPDVSPGAFVCLSVTDTGCGMSQEVQDHLFEPFFTTKEVGKGTGLGMAVIYGIVKQNKGWIQVDSKEGQDTCFKVYFPVMKKDKRSSTKH